MSERQRLVTSAGSRDHADDADRESRIEQLLLAGLDQYFAGRYEESIDIWTRVSFLERRNSRAKAYIERARGLVAEGQRETEALVHEGVTAYHAGDLAAARTLLSRAVDRGVHSGVHSDTAQLFLDRLHRTEALPAAAPPAPRGVAVSPSMLPARSAAWAWTVTAAASAVLAGAILVAARPIATLLADLPVAARPAAVAADPLPVARLSDRVLVRARGLRDEGRPHEALRILEGVSVADPARAAADALRAEIQRALLTPLDQAPQPHGAPNGGEVRR